VDLPSRGLFRHMALPCFFGTVFNPRALPRDMGWRSPSFRGLRSRELAPLLPNRPFSRDSIRQMITAGRCSPCGALFFPLATQVLPDFFRVSAQSHKGTDLRRECLFVTSFAVFETLTTPGVLKRSLFPSNYQSSETRILSLNFVGNWLFRRPF